MLTPFTPMLFMGEEWAASTPWQFFTSHPEPDLGRATAEGRIAEFAKMGWDESVVPDPQDPATFLRSKLRWEESGQGMHARMLRLYRELIALRRRHPEFTSPAVRRDTGARRTSRSAGSASAAGMSRSSSTSHSEPRTLDVPAPSSVLLATDPGVAAHDGTVMPAAASPRSWWPAQRPALTGARGQATPSQERSVSTIGPSSVMATVCSECAPREPSALRSVQPSGSVTSWSVVCRNQGSSATTSPARSG